MPRYQIQQAPVLPRTGQGKPRRPWVIYDNELDAYCALPHPNDSASLVPLEWPDREGAAAWMRQCVKAWEAKAVPVPNRWSTWTAPLQSPWATLPFVECGICHTGTHDFRPKLVDNHWVNACPRCQ